MLSKLRGGELAGRWRLWFGRLRSLLSGDRDPSTFLLSRWIFLRLLGAVYLIAFVSLGTQILGLIGGDGLLPARDLLEAVHELRGSGAYRLLPTLSWLSASDSFLQFLCWGGAGLSVLLIIGVAPVPALALLWTFYLSLTVVGQAFLSFQWDVLLLETGLLAVFYAPTGFRPRFARAETSSPVMRWLIWWLLFRLTFLSGITKVVSGDPTWANLTALYYHYETQPIPTWTSWYAHQLPDWFQQMSVGGMLFLELIVPFSIFAPPRLRVVRLAGCALLISFQILIAATGNYGFFNMLTIVLCLTLLDDAALRRVLPSWLTARASFELGHHQEPKWKRTLVAAVAITIVPISSLVFAREITYTMPRWRETVREPGWTDALVDWVAPFRSINGYGLFRVMTIERPEIVIEGSRDGLNWTEYEFRWKPGAVRRRPRFVAPHQPRLDWQMWFAALDPVGNQHWLSSLLYKLLEGSPQVLALLHANPFPGAPPRFVRASYYDYRFSTPELKRESGAWWTREFRGYLTRAISLTDR